MPLSKRHLDNNSEPVHFSVETLAEALEAALANVVFAYIHGSSAGGTVAPHSDIDLAFYLDGKPDLDFYDRVLDACRPLTGDLRVDIGILNSAEPIYRFEVLKGTLLFCRDQERWLTFYSVTSREYEHQVWDYERQRRYRVEAHRGS